jgi:hypothetical protein
MLLPGTELWNNGQNGFELACEQIPCIWDLCSRRIQQEYSGSELEQQLQFAEARFANAPSMCADTRTDIVLMDRCLYVWTLCLRRFRRGCTNRSSSQSWRQQLSCAEARVRPRLAAGS